MATNARLRTAVTAIGAVLASLALALACRAPATWHYGRQLEATSEPAQHGVRSEQLEEIMRSLDRLSSQRLPTSMDVARTEASRREEAAGVALALAQAAAQITPAAAAALPQAVDPERFRELAALLESRAQALARDVGELDEPGRRARLTALRATCAECHARYRAE